MMASPTEQEIRDYQKGRAQLGLLPVPPTLLLPFRFGEQPWSEATFTPHLVPEDRRPAGLELQEGQGLALQVALVDADTGLVRALRLIGLPTELSRRLLEETRALESSPWPGEAAYDRHINRLFASMTSEDIARAAEIWTIAP